MSDVERYRQHAEQAERLAHQMTLESQREQLLKIAADWRLMARNAELAAETRYATDRPAGPTP